MDANTFAGTPLGQDLTAQYGFGPADFARMARYLPEAREAAAGMRTPSGRARKLSEARDHLLRDLGATDSDIAAAQMADRLPVGRGALDRKWTMAIFAANCMDLAPGMASTKIEDASREVGQDPETHDDRN